MPYTLRQVAEFCYERQSRRDHYGNLLARTLTEWGFIVIDAAKRNKLYTVADKERKLIGVAIATERPATRTLWVHEIVCTKDAFPTFIKEAFRRFPGYQIVGNRSTPRGERQPKTYNQRNLWAATNQV